jgi:hypothetical protein
MPLENIPPSPSPERPPLAPYDPPEPAPQARAWRRALLVIGCLAGSDQARANPPVIRRATRHRW